MWVLSVRASHHFLTEADIVRLTPQAEGALRHIETLWIVTDDLEPIGFMGAQDRKIEMLFSFCILIIFIVSCQGNLRF